MNPQQAPLLTLAIPLLGAFAISLFGAFSRKFAFGLLIMAMTATFAAALLTGGRVLTGGVPLHYHLGGWPPPFGIELVIDHLNSLVMVAISGCALLTAIYSYHTAAAEMGGRLPHYYTLYALLIAGLLGMVATGDAFNLYVLLEISALSSYALLATGRGPAYYATFRYIIMGTIGACFYLLGVGYLYIKTGTLNMADLHRLLATPEMHQSETVRIGFILIIIGFWIKMGLFPLHGWLPNAYTHATTTTSCLIAPLMTKVAVYVMIRLMFSVFSVDYVFHTIAWSNAVVWLACAAILAGSVTALAQRNLKRMLACLIVAETGYMVGGAWLASAQGLTGAVYHLPADALMTLCLFMAVGAIIFKTGDSSLDAMRHLFRKMPCTATAFLIGALSMIGIPPTGGFFSKWYLITGAIETGHWEFAAALLLSSLLCAVLFFRLIEAGCFGAPGKAENTPARITTVDEAPLLMLIPMLLTAVSLVLIGIYAKEIVSGVIRWAMPPGLY